MINSGKLSYTSVVKHGKGIKVIDTSELIRSVWFSDGVIDDVKVTQNLQVLTALVYMIYNIELLYLKPKTMVLKGLLRLGDEHIDSLRQAMQLLEHKQLNLLHHPIPRGGNSGKILIPAMLEFSSPAIPGRS